MAGDAAWPARSVLNPADHRDIVGEVREALASAVPDALQRAEAAAPGWAACPVETRAAMLERAAELFEAHRHTLVPLAIREAGKTMANAVGELREAVDFLRYYAARARELDGTPLGTVVCISPWNFPLAIFTGQVSAALAAGNAVIAKPAEQTPLIAAEAVRLLHEAGIPEDALQLLPGDGATIGGGLVADIRCQGVVFTGSTEVARLLQRTLSERGDVPLIAETGGQNAMIVDSSALPEQVVTDVLASAFDSAGQRCSALRVLCLQSEIAPRILGMLEGAMAELSLGNPSSIEVDVGPVIDAEAEAGLRDYLARRRQRFALPLRGNTVHGSFVPPSLIEIGDIAELGREVFGPVLHVLRFEREKLGDLVDGLNATGYGLTLGVHSRIDETIDFVTSRAHVGNAYVNRNIIGAVVGVQPFGGEGLSGTGPKAGGPLYLRRLMRDGPMPRLEGARDESVLAGFDRLAALPEAAPLAGLLAEFRAASPRPVTLTLPGPVGETNTLRFAGRGDVLVLAREMSGLLTGLAAALATGNAVIAPAGPEVDRLNARLPVEFRIRTIRDWHTADCAAVLVFAPFDGAEVRKTFAFREGPLVPVIDRIEPAALLRLVAERTLSVNEAAAGGNAELMTI